MKFLVSPSLQSVSEVLGYMDTGDSVIQGRLEAYSCKRVSSDKKVAEELERKYSDQSAEDGPQRARSGSLQRSMSGQSVERQYSGFTPVLASSVPGSAPMEDFVLGESPGGEEAAAGSLGVIPDYSMRKLFINLLLTLNTMYPDYDFSSVRPEEFAEEPNFDLVRHSINSALAKPISTNILLEPALWAAIEEVIQPRDCSIYSYIPDVESSPFVSEGQSLWSFNYFMFNKNLKRVLFFTCACARPGMHIEDDSDDEMGYDEYDEQCQPQMAFNMEDM